MTATDCPKLPVPRRIGIFGWGVVAPKAPDIATFERELEHGGTWLSPFAGFGPSNILVGEPDFSFETYRAWFDGRFAPARFAQLSEKAGPMVKYALGAFIQALSQNQGLEQYLQALGTQCHVYVGTGLGDITVTDREASGFSRAQRKWNAFWAAPERCSALRAHCADRRDLVAPFSPADFEMGSDEWVDAKCEWDAYWASKSDELRQYLTEAAAIQAESVPPSSGSARLGSIRHKLNRIRALNEKWGCPKEPWAAVSADLLWNIPNIPAAQISIAGRIVGPAIAPVAACASFGVALKLAVDAIQRGDAKAVVVGTTDPPPHAMFLSAFYNANVLSADGNVSRPLTGLKGTHLSGGACIWIVGDADTLTAQGFRPLGMEIAGVGVSSDAQHIITPSKGGPQLAIKAALNGVQAADITTWDMHATATPGDASEIEMSLEVLHRDVMFTARKGTFGHGMSVAGGWELTAQHLGMAQGRLYPTALTGDEVHADVRAHRARFVETSACELGEGGYAGKLSMGVGGITACVISRPWDRAWLEQHTEKPGLNHTRAIWGVR